MVKLALYHMPGACSRVTMNALEEIGCDFDDHSVALFRGEQKTPEYLAINHKGKVPALVADGVPITENPAIIWYLASQFPDAGILPRDGSRVEALRGLSDLIWCSGTLHPMANRLFRPYALTDSGDPAGVKSVANRQLIEAATMVTARLAKGGWWYGDRWSIVDTYADWVFNIASGFGFDRSYFPALVDWRKRIEARPGFQRARQRELAAVERDHLPIMPGVEI